MSLQPNHHSIIVVTGANRCAECIIIILLSTKYTSGVGFGICQRLLDQLAQSTPPDSLFKLSNDEPTLPSPLLRTQRLTLVLACRNPERAKRARELLLAGLEKQVGSLKRSPTYDGHAEIFQKSVQIDFIPLDLCSIESVLIFAEEVQRRCVFSSFGLHWCIDVWQIPICITYHSKCRNIEPYWNRLYRCIEAYCRKSRYGCA